MKMSTYRKWALCFLGMNLMFVPSLVFAQRNDEATERLGKALEYFTSQKYHECLMIMQDLEKQYRLNPRYKAYLGVCYYYEWDYEHANKYLTRRYPSWLCLPLMNGRSIIGQMQKVFQSAEVQGGHPYV